jgi:hypothetical protein
MLSLKKRPCHIGTSINARTEKHGDEPSSAMDIPIAILITLAELNKLMGEPHTSDAWFSTEGGKLAEPLLKNMKPYKLKGKFANSSVTFTLGVNSVVVPMKGVTFTGMGFEPQVGGMTQLKLKIQSPITNKNNEIFLWMDRDADVELQFGELEIKEVQGDLDLEGDGDAPPATLDEALAADEEDQEQADIGTPDQERERARQREREIAQRLEADRNADKPKRTRRKASDGAVIN